MIFLRYFFPTFDDDNMLCFLEDDELVEDGEHFEVTLPAPQDENHNTDFPPLKVSVSWNI